MRNKVRSSLCLLLIGFAIPTLQGQDLSKGSIAGVVRDTGGAVLAGARVLLETPSGTRETTTDAMGHYVFPNLAPGSGYAVTVEKDGFRAVRQADITVRLNHQATLDFALHSATTQQRVEPVPAGQAIDFSTARAGTAVMSHLFQSVPVERNVSAIAAMAAGVTEGNAIAGAQGIENQYLIDGVKVSDPGFGGFGTQHPAYGALGPGFNFDFVEQVQVQGGGLEARYGQAPGGAVHAVTKSGTNAFHGSFYTYLQPNWLEAGRPDANRLTTSQRTRIAGQSRYDFGGELGGYLIRDKLFWYGGFNPTFTRSFRSAPQPFANRSLGEVAVKNHALNYHSKIDFRLRPNHQAEFSAFGDPSRGPTGFHRVTSLAANDALASSRLEYGSHTWTGRYNGLLPQNWTLSANFSQYRSYFDEKPQLEGYQIIDNTAVQRGAGGQTISGGLGFLQNTESRVDQLSAAVSRRWSWLGSHTLQFGYNFENVNYNDVTRFTGAAFQIPNRPEFGAAAGRTQYGAGLIRRHVNPADPTSPVVLEVFGGNLSNPAMGTGARYHAAFLEDSWSLGRRLTVRPGLRYEYQSIRGGGSDYVLAPNWAPRVGVIVDPTGSRQSKAFFSWGRFFERIPQDLAVRAFSLRSAVRGAWYRDQSGPAIDLSPANYVGHLFGGQQLRHSGWNPFLVAPGTRSQYQDEVVAGYEHELDRDLTVSARFFYRHLQRALDDLSGISLTQAEAGAPHQLLIANPTARLDLFTASGAPGRDGSPDGFPDPRRVYKAAEFALTKRFADNWQFWGNYRLARLEGNYESWYRSYPFAPAIASSGLDFADTDGRVADTYRSGDLSTDRRHTLRLFGNHQFTAGWLRNLNLGAGWNIQSGTPLSRMLAHPVYNYPGGILSGGRGALGRTDWTFPVDLRADYTVKVGEGKSLRFVADLFNLFNQKRLGQVDQNFELDRVTRNPDFLKPNSATFANPYQAPFHARLAVRFQF